MAPWPESAGFAATVGLLALTGCSRSALEVGTPAPGPEPQRCEALAVSPQPAMQCGSPSSIEAREARFDQPPLRLLTAGCETVCVVTKNAGLGPAVLPNAIHCSNDGGESFAAVLSLPDNALGPYSGSPSEPVGLGEDGTVFAVGLVSDGPAPGADQSILLYRHDQHGWNEGVTVKKGHLYAHEPSVALRGQQVVVWWLERTLQGPLSSTSAWFGRSYDSGSSFAPAERLDDGSLPRVSPGGGADPPSLCLAGADAVLASWFACEGPDCGGGGGPGRIVGMTALSTASQPFERTTVFDQPPIVDHRQHPPVVGCHRDGGMLVAWNSPYFEVNAATLADCDGLGLGPVSSWLGVSSEYCGYLAAALVLMGEERALVLWGTAYCHAGFAILDRQGKPVAPPTLGFDVDGDSQNDALSAGCVLAGNRFAVLAVEAHDDAPWAESGNRVFALVLDAGGIIAEVHELGALSWTGGLPAGGPAAKLACDAKGRVHALWTDDGSHYASFVPGAE